MPSPPGAGEHLDVRPEFFDSSFRKLLPLRLSPVWLRPGRPWRGCSRWPSAMARTRRMPSGRGPPRVSCSPFPPFSFDSCYLDQPAIEFIFAHLPPSPSTGPAGKQTSAPKPLIIGGVRVAFPFTPCKKTLAGSSQAAAHCRLMRSPSACSQTPRSRSIDTWLRGILPGNELLMRTWILQRSQSPCAQIRRS